MILPSPFSTAVAGIGGGPLLVKNGKPVFRANESFATLVADPPHRPHGRWAARGRRASSWSSWTAAGPDRASA